jgi:hypothetical protein
MADRTLRGSLVLPLFVIVLVISDGCIKMPETKSPQTGPTGTPLPRGIMETSMNISGVPLYYGWKSVAVSVEKNEANQIILEYLGGRDNTLTDALKIDIRNSRDRSVTRIYTNPQIGQKFTFDNIGTRDPDTVMVTAYFKDNTTQTILVSQI